MSESIGETHEAKRIVHGHEEQLPPGHYHIERDDGEDVQIKR